ncbi:hypothetical protein [Herbaspirillum sp. alder98]|uniref:hypothetical protein n=1 Tax=Herbaspirillum sp. alder98 TaxID=2913096 RepID=UPI001CD8AB8F|nr:hypothetical protein [Herbaspirillum sp. alder98]MCA1326221.1 hypothetical protein [Herbaspirillum sp. alder98]
MLTNDLENFRPQSAATRTSLETVERIRLKSASTVRESDQAEFYKISTGGDKRALPNHLARSNLIALPSLGVKARVDGERLVSNQNVDLRYWGKRLSEKDGDLWMQLMHLGRRSTNRQKIKSHAATLLKALKETEGGKQYSWLYGALDALADAKFTIRIAASNGHVTDVTATGALHMIDCLEICRGNISFEIDPRWARLYANNQYVLIDWPTRLSFGAKQALAKSLLTYICTSKESEQRRSVEWLRARFRYSSPMDKFKRSLRNALSLLEKAGVARNLRFQKNSDGIEMAVWDRL